MSFVKKMGNFSIAVFLLLTSFGVIPSQVYSAATDEYPPSQDAISNGSYEWVRRDLITGTINGKQYSFTDSNPYDGNGEYKINSSQSICDGKINPNTDSPSAKAKIDIDFGPTCSQTNPNAIEKTISKSENANVWFVWFNQDSIVQVADGGNTDRQYVREASGSSVFVQKGVDTCADKLILRSGVPAYVNIYRFDKEKGSDPQDVISAADLGLLKPAGCKLFSTYITGEKRDKAINYGLGETQNAGIPADEKPLGGATGNADETATCEGSIDNGFGWIICPALDLIDKFISGTEAVIASKLAVDTGTFNDSEETGSNLRGTWTVMARVASGLLVIVALVMILSTALSFDFVSAYTIKKVLPRIVIGAIGIWLSWPLVVAYISFMNDLGRGVASLMYSAFPSDIKSLGLDRIAAIAAESSGAGTDLAAGALFTGLAAASVGSIGIFGLLAAALAVAVAILVGIFVLAVREMLIIVFVIFAPIAIASWILPNTSKIWKFWSSNFNKLLLMFPMIMALFASAKIVAYVSAQAANANSGFLEVLFPVIIYVAPFFFLPRLFKSAGGILAGVTGAVNKASGRATGGAQKTLRGYADARKKVRADERTTRGMIAQSSGYKIPFSKRRIAGSAAIALAAERARTGQSLLNITPKSQSAAALQRSRATQTQIATVKEDIGKVLGGDLDARKAIASGRTLESYETSTDADEVALAARMKSSGAARFMGDSYAQAGATLGLAEIGKVDESHIRTTANNFSGDKQTAAAVVNQSTRAAKSAGQVSIGALEYDYGTGTVDYRGGDRNKATLEAIRTMSAEDQARLSIKIDGSGEPIFRDEGVQAALGTVEGKAAATKILADPNVKLSAEQREALNKIITTP